jgi:hypothetical protein
MKYEVIDNFLDEEYFDELVTNVADKEKGEGNGDMPWYFRSSVAYTTDGDEDKFFYMTHTAYDWNVPKSTLYEKVIPLLMKLGPDGIDPILIRVKANLYPNTERLHEHPMHFDYNFSHSAAILSLNTCDGYTKLKDGTKIDSVANRILLFDGSEDHCSTTTTNVPARFNINMNYIWQQYKE